MEMDVPWRAGQVGVENGYQFNGIERNEDFGLNVDLAEFRSYDAAVGRWWQVDPLAEVAPDWSPYRFGFNNPVLNTDPLGLFETRDEARQYKRDHDLRGKIRKQSDGSFAIENRRDHSSTFRDSELGVVSAALVAAPKDGYTGILGSDRREPYQGFWGGLNYLLTGGIDNGVQYNRDGYPLGPAPQLTMPPPVGPRNFNYVVYVSRTEQGITQYVGITNNLARRMAEHLANKGIRIELLLKDLSKTDAKAVEQVLIEIHKLEKNGGTLLNKINSISSRNPTYASSLKRGHELLKSIGYQ